MFFQGPLNAVSYEFDNVQYEGFLSTTALRNRRSWVPFQ